MRDPIGRRLQRTANTEDNASQHDCLAAANLLSDQQGDDGAEKASNLVDGDDCSLQRRAAAAAGCGVDLGELRSEGMPGQETRHDALVIAKTIDELALVSW